jgi:hypothetical protein
MDIVTNTLRLITLIQIFLAASFIHAKPALCIFDHSRFGFIRVDPIPDAPELPLVNPSKDRSGAKGTGLWLEEARFAPHVCHRCQNTDLLFP